MINDPTAPCAPCPASCDLRVRLERRFDTGALLRLRRTLSDVGAIRVVELDFSAVTPLDSAALHLLADDLADLGARGTHIVVRRLRPEIAWQLAWHPFGRFARLDDADVLFTDPDRDAWGFVPSDR